jgi:hypothetical protein
MGVTMGNKDGKKILKNKEQIKGYLECSDKKLKELIAEGLPVRKLAGHLSAYVDNIEKWWSENSK